MQTEQLTTGLSLNDYLGNAHAQAVQAKAMAEAVELMLGNDLAHHPVTHELASAMAAMISDLEKSLDAVNLPKGVVA